ncbi:MAG TPA: AbrB/MazE/SpoVT family DNA-binding domain-containing protein [Candidatus Eremiobacteraceae bacterium]|nr:AbrB/MazE/SpoVT family DNA-binding domain-containing protein [Candidatus Eremiobacteraceae bacterium]
MTIFISKWGNSLAVRLPKQMLERARMNEGDELDVEASGQGLVLRPRHRRSLKEMLAQITPDNLHGEMFAEGPVGNEAW